MSDTGTTSVLRACGLRKEYGKGEGLVRAVDGVDLEVAPGETLAVHGAKRLREVDTPAPAGRPGPALGRGSGAGRPAPRPDGREGPGPDAAARRRFCLPGLPSDGRAHRGGER